MIKPSYENYKLSYSYGIWIPFTHDLAMHYGDLQVDVETPDFYILTKKKATLQNCKDWWVAKETKK